MDEELNKAIEQKLNDANEKVKQLRADIRKFTEQMKKESIRAGDIKRGYDLILGKKIVKKPRKIKNEEQDKTDKPGSV